MGLELSYSYCINLTEEEKLEIDKRVKKDRSDLKYALVKQIKKKRMKVENINCIKRAVRRES